jgi:hypothetical protein
VDLAINNDKRRTTMATVTKVNGTGATHGTQFSVANLAGFEVDALTSLAAKGGLGSTIEAIVQEFQPLMYISTGTAGKIFMIVDGVNVTAASLQTRLQAMGTIDSINLSSATVVSRTLAAFDAT